MQNERIFVGQIETQNESIFVATAILGDLNGILNASQYRATQIVVL